MIKRTLNISAILLSSLFALPTVALVNNQSYVSVQAGSALPHGKLVHETAKVGALKKAIKPAAVFDIYAGTQVLTNTHVELELAYARHNFRNSYTDHTFPNLPIESFKTTVRTLSGFANLSYRFNNLNSFVVPYITAGAGISSNKVGGITISDPAANNYVVTSKGKTTNNAAWQIGAGALMKLTKVVSINLSYKYRYLGSVKTPSTGVDDIGELVESDANLLRGKIKTHNILLGVVVDL
jgi:opacity protein-like surface antigen